MDSIHTTGKRKKAVARAIIKKGTGTIRINKINLNVFEPEFLKLKIMEPLLLSGNLANTIDANIITNGGGITSQVEAARQAIARGIVGITKDDAIKNMFIQYDRSLLVYDPRRTEPHKQSSSSQGPRAKRQSSKR
ncbi:MAG: 30S ribosomal protein S9 [DPANN group archaeon]|nr:30S ribosomal protein S9 [DPANN group archaeon]